MITTTRLALLSLATCLGMGVTARAEDDTLRLNGSAGTFTLGYSADDEADVDAVNYYRHHGGYRPSYSYGYSSYGYRSGFSYGYSSYGYRPSYNYGYSNYGYRPSYNYGYNNYYRGGYGGGYNNYYRGGYGGGYNNYYRGGYGYNNYYRGGYGYRPINDSDDQSADVIALCDREPRAVYVPQYSQQLAQSPLEHMPTIPYSFDQGTPAPLQRNLPQPQPVPQAPVVPSQSFSSPMERTFPYDGGPMNPVPTPAPQGDAQPAPATQPRTVPPVVEGRTVSLQRPQPTKKYTYTGYGETPR